MHLIERGNGKHSIWYIIGDLGGRERAEVVVGAVKFRNGTLRQAGARAVRTRHHVIFNRMPRRVNYASSTPPWYLRASGTISLHNFILSGRIDHRYNCVYLCFSWCTSKWFWQFHSDMKTKASILYCESFSLPQGLEPWNRRNSSLMPFVVDLGWVLTCAHGTGMSLHLCHFVIEVFLESGVQMCFHNPFLTVRKW